MKQKLMHFNNKRRKEKEQIECSSRKKPHSIHLPIWSSSFVINYQCVSDLCFEKRRIFHSSFDSSSIMPTSQLSHRSPMSPSSEVDHSKEHIYTKLQVHYGGDIQDIVLKTEKDPTCLDLAKTLENIYRIPIDHQLVYYRGQRLHHRHVKNYDRPLSKYGIFPGNVITLVGKRGLL